MGTAEADLSIRAAAMLRVRGCGCGTDDTPTLSTEAWLSNDGRALGGTQSEAARLAAAASTAFCLSDAWTGKITGKCRFVRQCRESGRRMEDSEVTYTLVRLHAAHVRKQLQFVGYKRQRIVCLGPSSTPCDLIVGRARW